MSPLTLPLLLWACTTDSKSPSNDSGSDDLCADPSTWYLDGDGDSFGAGPALGAGCERPVGQVANDLDCDDSNPAVNPWGVEVCNSLDDDCDGSIDPSTAQGVVECWFDGDGDGFGEPSTSVLACACQGDQAPNDADCDDSDPDAWPGAPELLYDGVDQACDGMEGEYDGDGDGHDWDGAPDVDGDDCDDEDAMVYPDAWEDCEDDIDQDCDGATDECGLAADVDASDAWVRVYRSPASRPTALFSNSMVHAGDSDDDGRNEILGHESRYADYSELKFHLTEIPRDSEGDLELGEVTIATWTMPKADRNWLGNAWSVDADVLADVDLDGDGLEDYVFLSESSPLVFGEEQGPRGRLDFWSGPGAGEMSLDDASTVEMPARDGVLFGSTLELLRHGPGAQDLHVAAHLWPVDNHDEGSSHKGIALLSLAHLQGEVPVGEASAIWTIGGREPGTRLEAGDLDGDGIDEIVSSSQHYETTVDLPGRVWVFQGPIEGDRTLDDAELMVDGDEGEVDFGYSFAVLSEGAEDGTRGLLVTRLETASRPSSLLFFRPTDTSWPTTLHAKDAVARIDGNDEEAVSVNYMPRMVGDLDADGVEELAVPIGSSRHGYSALRAVLFEPPATGVHGFDLAETWLQGGLEDPEAGFGITLLGGVDYDGDTWSDLVVGEFYWDGNPETYHSPYGRYLVFRGEVGAR